MSPRGAWAVLVAAAACAAAIVALVLSSDRSDATAVWVAFGPLVVLSFVGTGLYATRARPDSGIGRLMVLLGFAWAAAGLNFANAPAIYTLALIVGGLWGGVFLQLVMTFPIGRIVNGTDRAIVIAGYLLFTVGSIPAMLFATPHDLGCDDCPENVLLLHHDAGVARALLALEAVLYAALLLVVLVRLARRWWRTPPLKRLQLTPVYSCGLITFALVTVGNASGGGADDPLGWLAFAAAALLPFAFLGGLLRSHVAYLDAELRARLEELRASRARLVQAGDAERRRLERDLHDGAQSRLVASALLLAQLRKRVAGDPEATALLEHARAELDTSLKELRELARGIHPAVLTERGLEPALGVLAARAPVPVRIDADADARLPPPVEIAAYFVVSEALANVAKYARASEASVAVHRSDGHVTVEVSDDGVGGADAANGSGLTGLADRVAALDGRLSVHSPPGEGTRLRVEIPCEPAQS